MSLTDLYTKKQIDILKRVKRSDWFMLINHGAVRAGKTQLNNDLFLKELLRVKANAAAEGVNKPMYILAAVSGGTLNTNILRELEDKYNLTFKFDKHGNFALFGVYIVTTFTGSIAGLRSIRGMTAYGAYINEASLANKEVFDEIIKRCSGFGARIICDTNPDNPQHWLKVDYIDKADNQRIIANHFELFDNTFLNQRYIDNLIATTPSGMFTDRGIYGRWTIAEGAIYADYNKDVHEVDTLPDMVNYFAGVDWGYDHYGSIVVVGEDSQGNYYLVDGIAEKHKEIDWWVRRAKEFQEKYGNITFYADSARPEHVDRFNNEGIETVNADKSVIAGIETIAKLFKEKKLFIKRGVIPRFFDEIYQYKWKPNSTKDEPLKEFDDVLDALRYAIYSKIMGIGSRIKVFKGGF
ncbi:PBSX family phage terminase large subunit [Streptococcus anginosus]|uniref:PBSX family phage terminase large subunit n=1 Tax=Streptococcus anginosus TaxID=1328 RepID=UPI000C7CA0AB|nr:PBSX family phage terminase large subunit [Streptococcus anginosus]MCW0945122.1 PBSX family phage terminase large subunit [Streptococcus anginosus]MCW1082755.1 PBSX family phage terminase large subunit [Streptococcus anginosus]MDI7734881.1 PBSX family phage terminase large subunit [Streptococcus anginosus]MED5922926.1 PBSX family phage terminase large subunit [Streptococcus anginosus]MED5953614.1 PBSX family phage terminase large subunit [Streptococcus anginosus]